MKGNNMLWIFKILLGLGFLALVFGFGYLWGSQKSYSVQTALNNMRSELTSKIEVLERGLHRTRMRMELMNARNHLVTAQTAVRNRNFGQAKQELESARKVILKIAETADPPQKQELTVLASAVQEIQKQVSRTHPPSRLGVEEVIRALDKFSS
jgi:hypothetical protein